MTTLKAWFLHYLYGLFAQCWDGAVASVAAIFTMDATGKLPEGITWAVVWHTFVGALAVYAVMYFKTNPLPAVLPTDAAPAPAASASPPTVQTK